MTPPTLRARAAGWTALALTLAVAAKEWLLWSPPWQILALPLVLTLALFWPDLKTGSRAFVLVGLALAAVAVVTGLGGWQAVGDAVATAGFIAALFTALSLLRAAADGATAIARAGRYLAEQPPGRRYGALTLGGQLFALPLSYGAIQLLGSLATASAEAEPDPVIRSHRRRRMLLAIQRGFLSTLAWSPLSFAMAISTDVIPGTGWSKAVWPGLVTMALFSGIGWGLDTAFRPRLSRPSAPRPPSGETARAMLPLAALLALLLVLVLGAHLALGIRVVGVVMGIVPAISAVWIVLQSRRGGGALAARATSYIHRDLPGYRGELTLLAMAGVIGTVGAPLLEPLVRATPLHPEALPGGVLMVALVWLIPLFGQIGMNPILAVTLIGPLLPDPASVGLTPTAMVVAATAGWTLSGVTSPFTATTLLTGNFGHVPARHVGLVWNGLYAAVMGLTMSAWVLVYGYLLT